jgi:hypothetical protein
MYDLDPAHELDNCSRCLGLNGGVRGNENRYPVKGGEYRLLCDYCSYAVDSGDGAELICDCGHPIGGAHAVMRIHQIEAAWEQGIGLSICGDPAHDYTPAQMILVLLEEKEAEPDNPCNKDWMTEISS